MYHLAMAHHIYHCRFSPPLATRRYPHLGDHVLVGWLLLADRPLPEMAPFTLRRREADLRGVHSVTVQPLSPPEGQPLDYRATLTQASEPTYLSPLDADTCATDCTNCCETGTADCDGR